jgi:hypothetical protein
LYTPKTFEQEAKRYGVARALPLALIKKLKWGEKILLAQYDSKKREALVFGYFIVKGLNHNLTEDMIEELLNELDIVAISKGGGSVNRRCGSYSIGVYIVVNNELDDIADKIREVSKKHGYKVKVFVIGDFYRIKPFTIKNAKFSRALVKVEVPLKMEEEHIKKAKIVQIKNYKQRFYLPKKVREALSLEEWL